MVYAIIYGLIFAVVGVGAYMGLCFRDSRSKSNQLVVEKKKYYQLVDDIKMLKETYKSDTLTDAQRAKVRSLYEDAVLDLKKQAAVITSLNQEL